MNIYAHAFAASIVRALAEAGYAVPEHCITPNIPPDMKNGDIAYPMFFAAKYLAEQSSKTSPKVSPAQLAAAAAPLVSSVEIDGVLLAARAQAAGPYVNVFLSRANAMEHITKSVLSLEESCGKSGMLSGKRIMIEFSAPNTNKPLHLGHLRNDAIGESMSRLFAWCGAQVRRVNLINDRGIHICKSMLAYEKFGAGDTPEKSNMKSDAFVGKYYVRFAQWEKEDETAAAQAQEMLIKWEQGDEKVRALWNLMNEWALRGIFETYEKTGISFDEIYKESETYEKGKEVIEDGLARGIFFKDEAGAICADLAELNLDKKVLLRADGTSVYITQDVGTAIARYDDWKFDRMVYVVAHEQNYHFTVLFHVLQKIGFAPAREGAMHHLGYGMVHLPSGRMKSREGTVVDADGLLDDVAALVLEEMKSREREKELADAKATAYDVALGAVHYFLLGVSAKKDVVFHPEKSIAFQGNTGPYLQYTCARIATMLQKFSASASASAANADSAAPDWNSCESDLEWALAYKLAGFQNAVEQAAEKHDPSVLAAYAYECACAFSAFYQSMPIATCAEAPVQAARLALTRAAFLVLRTALRLLVIPVIDKM